METPIHELCHSSCVTEKPNYKLLNDPGAKTMDHAFVSHEIIIEPHNYSEAIAQTDVLIWESAMQTEMNQHHEIGTWELVDLPPGHTAIGCQWVYTVKTAPDGEFEDAKKGMSCGSRFHTVARNGLL